MLELLLVELFTLSLVMDEALLPYGEWWNHTYDFAQGSINLCQMSNLYMLNRELAGET